MATIRWTQSAREDLRYIHDFIARESPNAADALVNRILAATDRLTVFPESGRILPEFPASGYREIISGGYRVIYQQEEDIVWVAAVVHGRRLLGDILGER